MHALHLLKNQILNLTLLTKLIICRSHLYRRHRNVSITAGANQEGIEEDTDGGSQEQGGSQEHSAGLEEEQQQGMDYNAGDQTDGASGSYPTDGMRSAALFILKAKEVRMLTQNALDGVLDDITGQSIL